MLDSLRETAATVGLQINTSKTEVLTVPGDLDARILFTNDGERVELPRCRSFVYLAGLVPSCREDLTRRRGLG